MAMRKTAELEISFLPKELAGYNQQWKATADKTRTKLQTLRISDYKPYWENGDNGGGRRCGAQKPMRASHIAVAFARPYRPWRDGSRSDLRTARGGAWPWSSTRVQAVKAIARRLAARTQVYSLG